VREIANRLGLRHVQDRQRTDAHGGRNSWKRGSHTSSRSGCASAGQRPSGCDPPAGTDSACAGGGGTGHDRRDLPRATHIVAVGQPHAAAERGGFTAPSASVDSMGALPRGRRGRTMTCRTHANATPRPTTGASRPPCGAQRWIPTVAPAERGSAPGARPDRAGSSGGPHHLARAGDEAGPGRAATPEWRSRPSGAGGAGSGRRRVRRGRTAWRLRSRRSR